MWVIGEGPEVSREYDLPADGIEDVEGEDPPLLQAVMNDAAKQIASVNADFAKGSCSYPGGDPVLRALIRRSGRPTIRPVMRAVCKVARQ